ncbi:helix-turn-helix transcriptional regulator [candidate division TA06 bacterium]|uniref:Helix-turn-helix transcriptional regulator n=1 Tax=candidate division TA06 bacterium TaxID=2250710 RepID=A0A933MIG9_UNCT6|nr:helix-turn-helix transcriptional regulator [candidate division TA06 bacterium]
MISFIYFCLYVFKTLGLKIRGLRKARGLTQEQLAEKCNLSVHHISGMGKRLACAFHRHIGEFVGFFEMLR